MSMQLINDLPVEVIIIAADGTSDTAAALLPRELATVQAVDAFLRANEEFRTAYPEARLERVESMRGVDEHRQGRYYLRYCYAGGVTEFWGHVSRGRPKFDFKKGIVGIVAASETPK
jgi:hypothetical protein